MDDGGRKRSSTIHIFFFDVVSPPMAHLFFKDIPARLEEALQAKPTDSRPPPPSSRASVTPTTGSTGALRSDTARGIAAAAASSPAMAELLSEVRILADLAHPHIVGFRASFVQGVSGPTARDADSRARRGACAWCEEVRCVEPKN